MQGLVATALRPRAEDLAEGVDVGSMPFGSWMAYRLEVEDWRSFQSSGIQIGNITLPLVREGESNLHRTMWFMVRDPGEGPALGTVPFPTLDLNGWINIHYNPDQAVKAEEKLSELKHVRRVMEATDRVVRENPDLPAGWPRNDPGAYGKLVHEKVFEALRDEPRWYSGVWVDMRTKQVLTIGAVPTGVDFNYVKELDLAYMKQGRVLTVGQVFCANDVVDLFEIKTTISGLPDADQRLFFSQLMGGKAPKAVSAGRRMRLVSGSYRVVDNARVGNKMRLLKKIPIAGAVVGVLCIVSVANGEEDDLYQVFVEKTRTYERSVDDSIQHIADGVEMHAAFKTWMQSWNPVDVIEHLVDFVMLCKIIANEWEPVPLGE